MPHARPLVMAALAAVLSLAHASTAAPAKEAPKTQSAGGVEWTVPPKWTAAAGSAMRVATYAVPAAKTSPAGECAVFFFGPDQGGSVADNVARWGRQFEGTPTPASKPVTVNGLKVTRAEVAGTYLAPGGPMMQSTGKRPGYRLLGAIVEAPEGNVFFKLTGDAATVAAAQPDFDALVASLKKK